MINRSFRYFALLFLIALALPAAAQYSGYRQPTAGELKAQLQKLQVLGSALYLAAHPDDENTRLIAYLANVEKVETGYLSLTRGDGGQNLIASDIRELLGLTRTEELLAARRVDGGEQFFSRANDFGYSKDPDETFTIWDRDQVLADAVWVIRKFRPDVIVNRFDHRTPGSTHGHHTASAILGVEAFKLAGDPTAFPEQLKYVEVWQPRRLFFNTSWWFYGSQEAFDKADKSRLVEVDVNRYLPKRGQSVAEIAAVSRSQHKSQGFGSSGARDASPEYLELIEGDLPEDPTDLFGGIETTWDRVEDGAGIGRTLARIEIEF
ncbi:MAG: PIG-L family deacetylase, partial [Saprospiraceae bacterium]